MSLHTPTLMVDGENDTLALSNTQRDYEAATVPVFLIVIQGSDHIYAARNGLGVIVAWLRGHRPVGELHGWVDVEAVESGIFRGDARLDLARAIRQQLGGVQ